MQPILMGSMPAYMPTTICLDCQVYFWLGFICAIVLAIILSLAIRHIVR